MVDFIRGDRWLLDMDRRRWGLTRLFCLLYINFPVQIRETMEKRTNRRGHEEHFVKSQHLKLDDLKEKVEQTPGLEGNRIFKKNIPDYPRPEFHVSHLKHNTNQAGLFGIRKDSGFKNPNKDESLRLVWWSLSVEPDEITSAEMRLLEEKYPDRTEEQAQAQQSFLEKFATSPAFDKASRMGSYRFTFPLEEVLNAYSEQFCSGAPPVMRVLETVLYKQEVMYVVVVHSPANQEQFSEYPLLTDDPKSVCTYRDGRFIWRSEGMCGTHSNELVKRDDEMQMEAMEARTPHQFYVWDHVAVALHVDEQVLKFDSDRLRENLKFCDRATVTLWGSTFENFDEAEKVVKELWPDFSSPLERA